jgi:hypothetical protein
MMADAAEIKTLYDEWIPTEEELSARTQRDWHPSTTAKAARHFPQWLWLKIVQDISHRHVVV